MFSKGVRVGFALVDDADYPTVAGFPWYAERGYARTYRGGRAVGMHALLMSPSEGQCVDHIDRDRANNQRSNLRLVTPAENMQNRDPVYLFGSSRYRGVSRRYANTGPQWKASATCGDKVFRGRYESELDAALAVTQWRLEHMPYSVQDPELVEFLRVFGAV